MPAALLDPADVAARPWANGAGTTRELAAATGADGGTQWRVSLADLERAAPFSCFPGLDRLLVALGPVQLEIDGRAHPLAAGEQVRFPGEARVEVSLDGPCRALNVMTRRDCWTADVALRRAGARPGVDGLTVLLGDLVADVRLARVVPAPRTGGDGG